MDNKTLIHSLRKNGWKLKEIGTRLNISAERVRQIENTNKNPIHSHIKTSYKKCFGCKLLFKIKKLKNNRGNRKFCSVICRNNYIINRKPKCNHCGSKDRLIKTSKWKGKLRTIQYYSCNKCNYKRIRKYYKTKSGLESARKTHKKYRLRNKEKVKAWIIARKIISKNICKYCKKTNVIKHHPDYSKPNEIIFVCRYHHRQIHKGLVL